MKNFKFLMFLSLVILSIVSCTKENIEGPEVVDPIVEVTETSHNALVAQVNTDEGFDLGCFSIDLPFDLTVDGVVSTIGSIEDFEAALTDAGETAEIDFIYPLNITYEDGETAVVADGEELGEAFAVCIPDGGWVDGGFPAYVINEENSCYTLVYPLTLTDLDGNSVTVEDEAAFVEALANNDILFFSFPLTLVDEDGVEVTAANDEELFGLSFECEGSHPPCDTIPYSSGTLACYDLGFPVSIIQLDADGNEVTVVVENEDDLNNSLLNGLMIGFGYPLTLIDEEGNETVVNSEEELGMALSTCFGPGGPGEFPASLFLLSEDSSIGGTCYSIQFPITIQNLDGSVTATVNNVEEGFNALANGEFMDGLVYPIDVTLLADNSTVTLNSDEELVALIEDCQ